MRAADRPQGQMNPVDPGDDQAIEHMARRHGFSVDAARAMWDAVILGNGSMAQFSHPEFGGTGQWMRGGMTMLSDMFNNRLKSAVDGLCLDLAGLASNRSVPAASTRLGSFQSPHQGSSEGASSTGARNATAPGRWWPGHLGTPNASGAQNGMRYAYFAGPRRLVIESSGEVVVYDTGDHRIGGVSQQQPSTSRPSFTSQWGAVDLSRLAVVDTGGSTAAPSASSSTGTASGGRRPLASALDVPQLIEKLAELHASGILTDAEFSTKKAELLRRI